MLTSGFPFLRAAALKRRLTSELVLIPISSYSCGSGSFGIGSESGSLINVANVMQNQMKTGMFNF